MVGKRCSHICAPKCRASIKITTKGKIAYLRSDEIEPTAYKVESFVESASDRDIPGAPKPHFTLGGHERTMPIQPGSPRNNLIDKKSKSVKRAQKRAQEGK